MLVRMGDTGVQVEQPTGLSGGEGYQVTLVFIRHEGWRGICPGEKPARRWQVPFSPDSRVLSQLAGAVPGDRAALAVKARKAWASMEKVTCRYQARYLRTW
jgi:hypothetical protein